MTDQQANELDLQLSSALVLKQKTLCVCLDFDKSVAIDASVHSRASFSAIVQTHLDKFK